MSECCVGKDRLLQNKPHISVLLKWSLASQSLHGTSSEIPGIPSMRLKWSKKPGGPVRPCEMLVLWLSV